MNNLPAWRLAIQRGSLKATTRHVLANLSFHMNMEGGSCFPSTVTQAWETGLSEKTVIEHLKLAEAAGYIKKSKRKRGGKGWASNQYEAIFPEGAEPLSVPKYDNRTQAAERGSVPKVEGAEPGGMMVLNEVQSNSTSNSSKKEVAYFWSGRIIKLVEADFRKWMALAGMDAGVEAELADYLDGRDAWLMTQTEDARRRWFNSTTQDIKNRFKKSGI